MEVPHSKQKSPDEVRQKTVENKSEKGFVPPSSKEPSVPAEGECGFHRADRPEGPVSALCVLPWWDLSDIVSLRKTRESSACPAGGMGPDKSC